MKTCGVGLIGCGGMGRIIAKKLLESSPEMTFRGLCDPDPDAIHRFRAEIASDKAVVYGDFRKLSCAGDIDLVMISSTNHVHREHAVAAIEAGKHVFCQKPLATTLDDCIAIKRAFEKNGVSFTVGFTLRYSPHYRKIKELIDSGVIGRIISMEFNECLDFNHGGFIMGNWRRLTKWAGTHLLEKCCHDIDLVNWMTGGLTLRAASFGGINFFTPENEYRMDTLGCDSRGKKAYRTWEDGENPFTGKKDIVDNQVAIIEYSNGVRATFHTNLNSGIPERRMYICGTEGAIRADVIAGTIQVRRIGFDRAIERVDAGVSGGHGGGDDYLVKELAATVLHGAPVMATLDDGVRAALTCFGIDRAMESGEVVDLSPLWEKAGYSSAAKTDMPAVATASAFTNDKIN